MLLPLSLLPVAVLLLAPPAPPRPAASITSITNGANSYSASQSVHIWRGEAAQLEVFGAVVGTAIGVDLLLANGTTPAPLMVGTITTRKPSSVVIRLDVAAPASRGTYIVRMRYAVAAGTPDQFSVRVYDRGSITGITASNTSPGVGESITITATGQNLEKAKLDLSQVSASPATYSVTSRSASSITFSLKFNAVGLTSIASYQFFDEDIGAGQGTLAAQFAGNVSRGIEVRPNPVISTVSPLVVGGSGTVTISGTNLTATDWTPVIRVDDMTSSNPELPVTAVSATSVRFSPSYIVNGRELHLRYRRNNSTDLVEVKLSQKVHVQVQPIISRAGEVLSGSGPEDCKALPPCPTGPDTRIFGLKQGGSYEIRGLWLVPATGTPVVVKHGSTTLSTTQVDNHRIQFTMPSSAAPTAANITVQTGGGTGTSPRLAYFTPPPSGLSLQRKDGPETGTYPYVAVTDGKLEPDRTYRVVGQNLHFLPAGLNDGTAYNLVAPVVKKSAGGTFLSTVGDGHTSFFIPPNHALGSVTLLYEHWGGSATIGTFQVVAPAAVVSSLKVEDALSLTDWYAGGAVQGTITERTIQSGTSKSVRVTAWNVSTGGILPTVSVTSSDPAVTAGGPYTFSPTSMAYDPNNQFPTRSFLSVPLQVAPVAATRNVTLTFKAGNNAGAIATVPITLTPVTLPKLESIAFEPGALTGGQFAKARVTLAATPPVAMSLPVATKATGVQLPASVTLSAKETVMQLPTPIVTVPTPVEVTVGTGTEARSASIVLHPIIRVQSLVPKVSPIPSGSVTDGVLTLNAPAWESITVSLTSGNTALLTVPSSITFQKGQSTASIPLSAAAGVPTVISVNVEAKIGQQTHTATIRVGPASP